MDFSTQLAARLHLISAVVITLVLFFIDEGAYDFNWALDAGNWFVFVIYAGLIYAAQALVSCLVARYIKGPIRTVVSLLVGTALALLLLFYVLFPN